MKGPSAYNEIILILSGFFITDLFSIACKKGQFMNEVTGK